ncbi:hypothetical protein BDR04DRAFT_387405 [Suillus decipiens]|nr:hypothetical protein BDR04DRAFT_387405 [Suillus decipiens]
MRGPASKPIATLAFLLALAFVHAGMRLLVGGHGCICHQTMLGHQTAPDPSMKRPSHTEANEQTLRTREYRRTGTPSCCDALPSWGV